MKKRNLGKSRTSLLERVETIHFIGNLASKLRKRKNVLNIKRKKAAAAEKMTAFPYRIYLTKK